MDVIYGLMPGMILLGLVSVLVLFWAARSGQFDDMDGEASRILMDEDIMPDHTGQKDVSEDKES
jgi:cbb3-type cytochrome oxidase maturation protein